AADWLLASQLSPLSDCHVKGPEFRSLMARLVHGRSPEASIQLANWRSEPKEQSRASLEQSPRRSRLEETSGYFEPLSSRESPIAAADTATCREALPALECQRPVGPFDPKDNCRS